MFTIVGDEYPRYPKLAYDGFPCEVLDILFCDLGQRFGFHPFHEVVDKNH